MQTREELKEQFLKGETWNIERKIGYLRENELGEEITKEEEQELHLLRSLFTWTEDYQLDIYLNISAEVQGKTSVSLKDYLLNQDGDGDFDYEIEPSDFDRCGEDLFFDGMITQLGGQPPSEGLPPRGAAVNYLLLA